MTRLPRVGLVLAVTLAALAAGCGGDGGGAVYEGLVRDPAPAVDGSPLPDASADGRPLAFRAEPGGVLLVYFGYTLCPDVCPTTLADLRIALSGLAPGLRERVQVAVVTIDPERDTAPVLRRYVRAFFREGHALRTDDPALLAAVAKAFGAGYEVTTGEDGEIEVGHTAFTYAVDDSGRLRVQWGFGTRPGVLRRDLRTLLEAEAA